MTALETSPIGEVLELLPDKLAAVEQLRWSNGWPVRRRPVSHEDWLIAVLAYRLADSPHIQRAYGPVPPEDVQPLDPADIAVASRARTLERLVAHAVLGATIPPGEVRLILAKVGMPAPASLDIGSVVAVAAVELREKRRALLAAELVTSTSTVHRKAVLAKLAELEVAA